MAEDRTGHAAKRAASAEGEQPIRLTAIILKSTYCTAGNANTAGEEEVVLYFGVNQDRAQNELEVSANIAPPESLRCKTPVTHAWHTDR
jgi:hypothetical protein